MRLSTFALSLGATLIGSPAHAQASDTLRPVTLPGAHCRSGSAAAADTVFGREDVDSLPDLKSLGGMIHFPESIHGAPPGYTLLRFIVRKNGRVDPCHVWILHETSPAWTTSVLEALNRFRFSAARRQGVAVSTAIEQRFDYRTT